MLSIQALRPPNRIVYALRCLSSASQQLPLHESGATLRDSRAANDRLLAQSGRHRQSSRQVTRSKRTPEPNGFDFSNGKRPESPTPPVLYVLYNVMAPRIQAL